MEPLARKTRDSSDVVRGGVVRRDVSESALDRTDAYRYELPEALIAKVPADPPDAARLLVVTGDERLHRTFADVPAFLRAGDVLVVNETRVIRARLHGRREPGGGAAEIFLLRPVDRVPFDSSARTWCALVKPGRKLAIGTRVRIADDVVVEIVGIASDGVRHVRFETDLPLDDVLERHGEMPLPPYVGAGDADRDARYQTVFARVPGSVAAPTASLHFTQGVLDAIVARGVTIVPLVLDVGLGTFRPMDGESIHEHTMHSERYEIPVATADAVNAAKRDGRRVVVAGTTAMRALEASAATHRGIVVAEEAETSLFISPGFRFAVADVLITNFHLPMSTLLVLVTTFGGYARAMAAYDDAIAKAYRFFSFGDAMLLHRGAAAPMRADSGS